VCGRLASSCISPPPALSGSSLWLIQMWVTPPGGQQQVLIDSSPDDDELLDSHECLHMYMMNQYVYLISEKPSGLCLGLFV
jgi:hypothetical protein